MVGEPAPEDKGLWIYTVLPPAILNVAAVVIFGGYYALREVRPELVSGISPDEVQVTAYLVIFVVEWVFAIRLLRQRASRGTCLSSMMAPGGDIWGFRWPMAILLFAVFNGLFVAYVPLVSALYGEWPRFEDLRVWQRLFLVLAIPFQAAFCEELIWRGHVVPVLMRRGRSKTAAVLLAAVSFALLHGVLLPDKLLLTFLIGIVAGAYYVRERTLLPLMITHFVADMWMFGLSVF
jgi:membrane protease YdiL (CAAX protease family)